MEFVLDNGQALYQIKSYKEGKVVVNKQTYNCPILILPERLIAPWPGVSLENLNEQHFEALLIYKPDIVLLGTGLKSFFPHPRVFAGLMQHKIGFEIMNSAAACRTYMVLMAEDRNVAIALLA